MNDYKEFSELTEDELAEVKIKMKVDNNTLLSQGREKWTSIEDYYETIKELFPRY